MCTTMPKRAGRTVKLSISIDRQDLELLRKRAKRVSDGNISAAIAETIRIAGEWEGRKALLAWLGEGRDEPSAETMESIRAEWRGARRGKRRTKAA
jgi:hypothetical protein